VRALIGLGVNLGEPAAAFSAAAAELRGMGQVVRASSLYDGAARIAITRGGYYSPSPTGSFELARKARPAAK
jgi:hypothetical protein